jgi:hypothetical protein
MSAGIVAVNTAADIYEKDFRKRFYSGKWAEQNH